jgi:RTX calcium-binding nonapeptide repeat (4 copies)
LANQIITLSVTTAAAGDHAFDLATDNNVTMLVEGVRLLAAGANADGINAPGDGVGAAALNTFRIDGRVYSEDRHGINLGTAVNIGGSNMVSVGKTGLVAGAVNAINSIAASDRVENLGSIFGGATGIAGGNGAHVFNAGSISAGSQFGVSLIGSFNSVVNSGTIFGGTAGVNFAGGSSSTVINSGLISGGEGSQLQGAGIILAGGSTDYVIDNSGTIASNGVFSEAIRVDGTNNGNTTINNSGVISAARVAIDCQFTSGIFAVNNSGTINGDIRTGGGTDIYDGENGLVNGLIDMGNGTDEARGGAFRDRIRGGGGVDTVYGNGGNDIFVANGQSGEVQDQDDIFDGGDGTDTYDAAVEFGSVYMNLEQGRVTSPGLGNDILINVENLVGGSAADTMIGDDLANSFKGNNGNDVILGQGGRDRLVGNDGADRLTGGLGKDYLYGGAGNDFFDWNAAGESTRVIADRDLVADFTQGQDVFDVFGIDADTILAGNNAFVFINGAAFSGTAGELRWFNADSNTFFQSDTNGDSVADLEVQVLGTFALVAADFVL